MCVCACVKGIKGMRERRRVLGRERGKDGGFKWLNLGGVEFQNGPEASKEGVKLFLIFYFSFGGLEIKTERLKSLTKMA